MQIGNFFISEFTRDEFLTRRWHYRAGDHVTFIAPTDYGKTTLCMQLLEHSISPRLPVYNLAGKPRDAVMKEFSDRLGLIRTEHWPPPTRWRFWRPKPLGYTIWPPITGNEDLDDPRLARTFRDTIRYCARKGNCIINVDEFGELKELGLDRTSRAVHRRGRSNGAGMWGGIQGPTHAETHAYSQAGHLFLGHVSDERHRQRFGEIGGFDRKLIEQAVLRLPDRHWLYIRRRGRVMCIIGD